MLTDAYGFQDVDRIDSDKSDFVMHRGAVEEQCLKLRLKVLAIRFRDFVANIHDGRFMAVNHPLFGKAQFVVETTAIPDDIIRAVEEDVGRY